MEANRSALASLVCCLAIEACAGAPGTDPSFPVDATSAFNIQLHRSGCFGRCPSYSVTIAGDGVVDFTGERFVGITGPQRGQASPQQVADLQRLLHERVISKLADAYVPGQKTCPLWATDFPSATLDWTQDGSHRHIEHYLGCEGVPPALTALEKAIDDAAGVRAWIDGKPLS